MGYVGRYSSVGPGCVFPRDRRDTLELHLVSIGQATHVSGQHTVQVGPRMLFWRFPGQQPVLRNPSEDYQASLALFDAEMVRRVRARSGPDVLAERHSEEVPCKQLTKLAARRLWGQFEALSGHRDQATQFDVALTRLLLSAWDEFQQATAATQREELHPAVEKAATMLRTRPMTSSLDELAKICGASASWLSRLFREQMGVSLVDYRNDYRMDRFFELYRNGLRRNITQAALEAGFGSYAQFHRVFRKKLGYGPAEMRRRQIRGS